MGTTGTFRNPAMSGTSAAIQSAAARIFDRLPALGLKVRNAGEVADFVTWKRRQFGDLRISRDREALWSVMADQMPGEWHVLEFGVAWGYATDWWLRRLTQPDLTWDGFDRFTGLPRAWREEPAGAYSADGLTPALSDPRITWHVGDVEETMPLVDPARFATGRRAMLFDLDIYEPTAAAWSWVAPLLRPGDLLYFDEAMDASDERRVLDELVLPTTSVRYVGSTSIALALEVV
jgi:hypothetical protein